MGLVGRKEERGNMALIVHFREAVRVYRHKQTLVMTSSACVCPWLMGYKSRPVGATEEERETAEPPSSGRATRNTSNKRTKKKKRSGKCGEKHHFLYFYIPVKLTFF